jgi:RNA polymerase sigma factor (TIGR02999 family)
MSAPPPDLTAVVKRCRVYAADADAREASDADAAASDASAAIDEVYAHVYDALRGLAHRHLAKNRRHATLNTTSLVHEAYLRLVDQSQLSWKDRAHFLAIASRAMRFVLVDAVRRRMAAKRGGGATPVSLETAHVGEAPWRAGQLLDLHDALDTLASADARAARVVECRFFGGLSVPETAEALGVSGRTVKRDWRKARLLLYRLMQPGDGARET